MSLLAFPGMPVVPLSPLTQNEDLATQRYVNLVLSLFLRLNQTFVALKYRF